MLCYNLLNIGDIPNIWQSEEAGRGVGRDDVMAYFNTLVRPNLHVVFCMSPSGKSFRTRLRQFPLLVNCCTLDWYDPWPSQALLQVAHQLIANSINPNPNNRLCQTSVLLCGSKCSQNDANDLYRFTRNHRGGSFVTLIDVCNTATGNAFDSIDVKNNLKSGCILDAESDDPSFSKIASSECIQHMHR
ncbi:MAG: putative dynein heavy chain axonemal [Streblomastix strix]|uniref:Putative dynein heavy chain axonemal n=1 Tax=Streblomastix strix TaxID=222440 RepID=A0A5J4VW81_9EUKA|nr:MAG: putative dynein heavy chain axonemal [Streblomastix strix]